MQRQYVFAEFGQGIRRNLTMTVSVIMTIFISLSLVGFGLLLHLQAGKAEDYWGSRLQITVFMCTAVDQVPNCVNGTATEDEKAAVVAELEASDEVRDYEFVTSEQAYQRLSELYESAGDNKDAILDAVEPSDLPESYRVTLNDPEEFEDIQTSVSSLNGVSNVADLRNVLQPIYDTITGLKWGAVGAAGLLLLAAILQVSNTIHLTAMSRRKEIGIMRLVGASSWYIQMPFVLEALFAAVIGIGLASASVLAFMKFIVYDRLTQSQIVSWIQWSDALWAISLMAGVGVALSVIPTLLLTRKYLKV